jgi:hypothetical protein
MVLGIPIQSFAFFHTLITLVTILSGLVMLVGMIGNRRQALVHAVFLLLTVATVATGFIIQVKPVTPAVALGFLVSVLLIVALPARYVFGMRGAWRWIYVVTATASLYFNCFVLVVQTFQKVPALHAIAPGIPPTGPIFGATQGIVLIAFVIAGYLAVRRYRP